MIAIVQRVLSAAVTADGFPAGEIGPGLLILLGVVSGDGEAEAAVLAAKTAALRIFCDEAEKMNRSLLDTAGGALVVSNFTLAANVRKGNRPSYFRAAGEAFARPMYERFVAALAAASGRPVRTGEFGADMKVELLNDGPFTLVLDSEEICR